MKRATLNVLGMFLLCTAGTCQSVHLQQLQLNDPVLVRRLTSFIQLTKAKWLSVYVQADSANQSYTYYIRPVEEYELVRNYRGHFWGEWQQTILLFYISTDLPGTGRVLNVEDLANLRTYARLYLPRIQTPVPRQKGVFLVHFHNTSNAFNEFKVIHGREVYFRNSGRGYIEEPLVPDSLPPVPEPK